MLSVVIPAYNEEAMISKTAEVIQAVLSEHHIDCELIFVDDGSTDRTWEELSAQARVYRTVRGVRFSRNFGKESAILAGLSQAKGDCCVVIDCDLQHPPEKIPEMYALWQQGYEVIEGKKSSRGKETAMHGLAAKGFYAVLSKASGIDMSDASDFKLLDRRAVDAIVAMPERSSFFRALSSWIGFRSTFVEFEVRERVCGQSKWSPLALSRYALRNITAFSATPMHLITLLGVFTLLFSLVLGTVALVQKLCGQALEGFTTVILILLFSSSIIMISLGIIGYYIARIYEEVKARPRYIIAGQCGENAHETAAEKVL